MTILETITQYKKWEVASKKEIWPVSVLERSLYFEKETLSLTHFLKKSTTGIIAEHKRKSPSKSVINDTLTLPEAVKGYELAGASGISVLTDTAFFGGSLDDLSLARKTVTLPILRKEFIIDPYQLFEAKAYGADAILLIAACLSKAEVKQFSELAKQLQLEVLVEIHHEKELEIALLPSVDIIGVNNRNLKTFEVSLQNSIQLAQKIPSGFLKISESGIHSTEDIKTLKKYGFEGFLIGELFMKTKNPGETLKNFISTIS
ncbi:MAG: indole-3-glycerol phosphate synthase TrpC [Flavobacteriaceae bacterium]